MTKFIKNLKKRNEKIKKDGGITRKEIHHLSNVKDYIDILNKETDKFLK